MKQYEFMKDTDENGNKVISVSDKPKRKLDLIPRFVCFLIALGVWLWMVNFNDVDMVETMVLKIDFEGQSTLEKNDMMIYGLDKREVTVNIKGSNRDLRKYSAEDYRATVDLSDISEVGQYTLPLNVTTPTGSSLTLAEAEVLNVNFMVDFIAEKEVTFDVLVANLQESGQIKYSYEHVFVDDAENVVSIKGPANFIEQISSARLNVDGSFAASSDEMIFSDFPLSFLDKNLNPIVIDNGAIEYSTEEIDVCVSAIAHKEVPVKVYVLGSGSDLVATPSIKAVEVWGAPSLIKYISEYTIMLDRAEMGKDYIHTTSNKVVGEGLSVTEGIQITIRFADIADAYEG